MHGKGTNEHVRPRRRQASLLAGALGLGMVSFGAMSVVNAVSASAFSPLPTLGYTISGAPSAVTGLSAAVTPNTQGSTGNYTVQFTTPLALSVSANKAGASYLRLAEGDAATGSYNHVVSAVSGSGVGVVDPSTGYTFYATVGNGFLTVGAAESNLASAEAAPLVVYLGGTGSVHAGDTLMLTFAAINPAPGSYTFYASTSSSPGWQGSAGAVAIAAGSGAMAVTASSYGLGTGASYQMSSIAVPATIAAGTTTIELQACTNTGAPPPNTCSVTAGGTGGTGGVTFSSNLASYQVVDTTTNAILGVTAVTSISPATSTKGGVLLQVSVPSGITAGNELSLSAVGVNPASNESDYFVADVAGVFHYAGPAFFGGTVSALSLSLSSNAAGSSSTYDVSFNVGASGALAPGGSITVEGPTGTVFAAATGATVTDNTTGATQVLSGLVPSTTKSAGDTLTLVTNITVADNNTLTIQVYNVQNPPAGTYGGSSGLSVWTTSDPTPAYAPSYVIGSVATGTGPSVSVSPNTAGALATYTIGTFKAAATLVGGVDTIEVLGPAGTELPASATLSDSTTSTGTQTMAALQGAGSNDVRYRLASTVQAGDLLTLTMPGTVNPSGGNYNLYLGADTEATNTTAAGAQGLAATSSAPATTTTTTTVPPTTTTAPPRPAIDPLSARVVVSKNLAGLKLHCTGAYCHGSIRLWYDNILLAQNGYALSVGGTGTFYLSLNTRAMNVLEHANGHALVAGETVFVNGGYTARRLVTLVAPAPTRPAISALTGGRTRVSVGSVGLRLRCASARCRGTILLWSHNILLARSGYGLSAGGSGTFYLNLNSRAMHLLASLKGVLASGQTIFVDGGSTVRRGLTLVG